MAVLTYDVMFGDVVNINIRNHEDANSIIFNVKDSNGVALDISDYTNLTFRIYDIDGLPYADYRVTLTPILGTTGQIKVSWDYSSDMNKLNWGYNYFYRIDADDTGLTNQRVIPTKGNFYIE